ncbi:MAG: V-type ATP synthase subunit D [Candidatus Wallbacteria bacterium]|nr:V-type ATP synthase subunit D [Candidatus Wallbacteria bacterium]
MSKLPVTPTKGNLIKLKIEYRFVQQGHKLLDEKKRVLIAEIMKIVEAAQKKREELNRTLPEIFRFYYKAQIFNGERALCSANVARHKQYQLTVLEKSFIGVIFPTINFSTSNLSTAHSLIGNSSHLDLFLIEMQKFMKLLFELIEVETRLWRLGFELKKVMKRVNALEYIILPQYEETLKFIEEVLEEIDREDFFMRKVLKRRRNE